MASHSIERRLSLPAGAPPSPSSFGRGGLRLRRAATERRTPPPPADPIRIGAVFPISGNAAAPRAAGARRRPGGRRLRQRRRRRRRPADRPRRPRPRGAADAPAPMAALKADGVTRRRRRLLVGPVDRGEPGGDRRRPRLLGGRRGRRPADRPRPAARLPGRRERHEPRDELGVLRGDRARASARHGRHRRSGSRSSPPTTTTPAPSPRPRRRRRPTRGTPIVAELTYDLVLPDWPGVMATLAAARPDVIILASHIPDGVAFRRAMLAAGLQVGALIGSTMAECDPDFAGDLGADAVGSSPPTARPAASSRRRSIPAARALYDRFAAAWASRRIAGSGGSGRVRRRPARTASASEYSITGPVEEGSVGRRTDRGGPVGLLRRVGPVPRRPAGRGRVADRSTRQRSPPRPAPSTCRPDRCRTVPGSASRRTRRRSARTSAPRRSSGSGRRSARTPSSGRRPTRPAPVAFVPLAR